MSENRQIRIVLMHAKAAQKAARREKLVGTELTLGWFADRKVLTEWLRDEQSKKTLAADIEGCMRLAVREMEANGNALRQPYQNGSIGSRIIRAFCRLSPTWSRIDDFSNEGLEANLDAMREAISSP